MFCLEARVSRGVGRIDQCSGHVTGIPAFGFGVWNMWGSLLVYLGVGFGRVLLLLTLDSQFRASPMYVNIHIRVLVRICVYIYIHICVHKYKNTNIHIVYAYMYICSRVTHPFAIFIHT